MIQKNFTINDISKNNLLKSIQKYALSNPHNPFSNVLTNMMGQNKENQFNNIKFNNIKKVGLKDLLSVKPEYLIKKFTQDKQIPKFRSQNIKDVKGTVLIEKVKKYLLENNIQLERTNADKKSLDKFVQILVGANFNKENILDFANELQLDENIQSKGLNLSDLFARVSTLTMQDQDNDILDISSLPHVETLMSMLGLDSDQRNQILSSATEKNKGISISKLISNLKAKKNNPNDNILKGLGDNVNEQIIHTMKSLDMGKNIKDGEEISIDTVIAELKKISDKKQQNLIKDDDIANFINEFASNIQPIKKDEKLIAQKTLEIYKSKTSQNINPDKLITSNKNMDNNGKQEIMVQGEDLRYANDYAPNYLVDDKAIKANVDIKNKQLHEKFNINEIITNTDKKNPVTFNKTLLSSQKKEILSNKIDFDYADLDKEVIYDKTDFLPNFNEQQVIDQIIDPIIDQVVNQIAIFSQDNNENDYSFSFNTKDFGRFTMSTTVLLDEVKASIIVESQAIKDMLTQHSIEIKTAMVEQGLIVEKIDFYTNSGSNQSFANSKNNQNQYNEKKKNMVFKENKNNKLKNINLFNKNQEGLSLVA